MAAARTVPAARYRQDDVAHERKRPARDDIGRDDAVDERRIVLLEKPRRIDDQPFGADRPGSQERDRAPEAPVRVAGGGLEVEQRRVALEGESEKRRELPVGARGPRRERTRIPRRVRILRASAPRSYV